MVLFYRLLKKYVNSKSDYLELLLSVLLIFPISSDVWTEIDVLPQYHIFD